MRTSGRIPGRRLADKQAASNLLTPPSRWLRLGLESSHWCALTPHFFGSQGGQAVQDVAMKTFAIRVPTALGERLEELALRENNHISAVTRRLLTIALDHEDALRQGPRAPKVKR